MMRSVVAEVLERTGITISVGIGPSRLVAKTASDAQKPAGFVVLSREQACEAFADRPTRFLHGVGPKTADRLLALGVGTVTDLQRAAEAELAQHFGERMSRFLKARALFHDDSPVETERVAKSRSNETTYDEDVSDLAVLEDTVRRLAEDLCEGLERRGVRGRTIGIKVRLDDWTTATRVRTIDRFANDLPTVTEVALELLREYAPPRPVRLVGVRVASFEGSQGSDAPSARRSRRVPPEQLALPV
jgi:DNA polymerase-4